MYKLIKLKELILDLLFPPLCIHCQARISHGNSNPVFCLNCEKKIQIHSTLFCPVCKNRLPNNINTCHKSSKYLLAAVTNYEEPMKSAIQHLKYDGWTRVLGSLKKYLQGYIESLSLDINDYIIIPIPLHPDRLKERGFNQAEILGQALSDILQIPMKTDLLIREKKTESQVKLKNYDLRRQNLDHAFKIKNNSENLKNKNIILVDDVHTSGSTMSDAARELKSAGTKKIIAFVIAKA